MLDLRKHLLVTLDLVVYLIVDVLSLVYLED
jgi:hypothetical protein